MTLRATVFQTDSQKSSLFHNKNESLRQSVPAAIGARQQRNSRNRTAVPTIRNEDDTVRIGNHRGNVLIHVELLSGVQRGVVIVESIWPNHAFIEGKGINVLTGSDPVAPVGGAAFHDNRVWIRDH